MAETLEQSEQRFRERYLSGGERALIQVEMEVLGSDYQANGYTTVAQADELGRVLRLGTGDRLLDVGAGCGWPGLYLAKRHGCELVSTDPVDEGMVTASSRAHRDGLADRHRAIAARGDRLPLRSGSFDAALHTDVVC